MTAAQLAVLAAAALLLVTVAVPLVLAVLGRHDLSDRDMLDELLDDHARYPLDEWTHDLRAPSHNWETDQ